MNGAKRKVLPHRGVVYTRVGLYSVKWVCKTVLFTQQTSFPDFKTFVQGRLNRNTCKPLWSACSCTRSCEMYLSGEWLFSAGTMNSPNCAMDQNVVVIQAKMATSSGDAKSRCDLIWISRSGVKGSLLGNLEGGVSAAAPSNAAEISTLKINQGTL